MHNGLVKQAEKFNKRVASRETDNYRVVKRGELVVGFPIDEAVLATQQIVDEGIVSPAYSVWSIDITIADPVYLERFLRSDDAISYYKAHLRGTTARRRTLPPDKFQDMPVPLPSLDRQHQVVSILDKIDSIRSKREQALVMADELLRSVFLEIFGDPSANPKGYPVKKFETILLIPLRNGLSPSSKGSISANVLTLTAITGDRFDADQVKEGKFLQPIAAKDAVNSSDFYICRGSGSSDLIGKGYFADRNIEDTAFPDTMIAAKPDPHKVTRAYMEMLWNGPFVRTQIREAARTTNGTFKINQTAAGAIKIPIPPLPDQKKYQAITEQVRQSKSKLAYGDDLFPAVSQRAFRGEL
jgi:type I restriction enzyme S subunit